MLHLEAPIETWDEAIPLGNGLLGGLLWGSANTIHLSLDRGDLWDERLPEVFHEDGWNFATHPHAHGGREPGGDQPPVRPSLP